MATFTIRLSELMQLWYPETGGVEYATFEFEGVKYGSLPVIPQPELLGLATYPIFNEEYRAILNGKILDQYFNREIGTETVDNFRLNMRRKMDQIMPYYNKLYLSEKIPYTALDTMRIHSVGDSTLKSEETSDATNTANSETGSSGRAVSSETPQTMLSGSEDYATGATDSNSSSEVSSSSDQTNKSNSESDTSSENLVTGYQAVASDLVMRYRNSLLNIDLSVLSDIEDCFMLLLNNGDSYTANPYFY